MTELEKLQRAKMYIDKMANGINPIDDKPFADDDAINNVRISRCLFYVSDVLNQVIDNNGVVGKTKKSKVPKAPFTLSLEEIKQFTPSEIPMSVTEISDRLNGMVDLEKCKKINSSTISNWLVEIDLLEIQLSSEGKKTKRPTQHGNDLGIFVEDRIGMYGPYSVVLYNANAQQFIVDNIDAIVESKYNKNKEAENQGIAWSSAHEECLIDLFNKNVPVEEIAITLKRTETGIRARLKKLGLIDNRADAK